MNELDELESHLKLQYSIAHPDLEACYIDGYQCVIAGTEESENPHEKTSREYEFWQQGWWAGLYEEAPLFALDKGDQAINGANISGEIASANDECFVEDSRTVMGRVAKVATAIAATAFVGYQFLDMMA